MLKRTLFHRRGMKHSINQIFKVSHTGKTATEILENHYILFFFTLFYRENIRCIAVSDRRHAWQFCNRSNFLFKIILFFLRKFIILWQVQGYFTTVNLVGLWIFINILFSTVQQTTNFS